MKDYTKLTDSELLEIIDSSDVESEDYRSIKELSATDSIFRSRVIELKVKNKDFQKQLDQSDMISLLEESISNSTDEEVKKYFTEKLSTIKSILNK